MNNLIDTILKNKKRLIILVILLIIIILLVIFINKIIEKIQNDVDISNAICGVIIDKDVIFYKKPKESRWKKIRKIDFGEEVYIIETFVDKKNNEWYKIKAKDRVGYVQKNKVGYYEFSNENGNVLMSDVSKFNVIYKHFNTSGEYAAFILKSNINYAYIRLGGRGYGEEGNLYTDPEYKMFIDACEYLGVPYGFYYIDEAITSEELDEEVEFVCKFMKENATKLCVLPLVIDVESHDGVGRADNIWENRSQLLSELTQKFKGKNIETLIYSNATTANEYLYSVDSKFWIAYYISEKKVPNYWYTETDQEATKNTELMDKVVGWQFTESGAGDEIDVQVDISLVKNDFFKKYVINQGK